ncbi:uncharacterized protein LOC8071036 isoform X2 [Sorghum bicolor]|uniref:Storage protein n=1 Tax=Sorghum bicolor TaxID=4558 RepID=A0A1Z5R9A6_SORBI|nr:uncharacterized protein LOC8071036 isoform X2 [Sorghum bicolor]OQU80328.1 hypothetical protein SORBI_3007G111800 [Sorghum bicolor]|eukprot:XP_021321126.1 uncharacterized protein LOC8071036 isoform X2 [Sorghum bicolor]
MKKPNPILTVLSAASIGFLIGVSFPLRIAPTVVFPFSLGDGNCIVSGRNILARFSTPFGNSTSTAEGTPVLQQSNATSDSETAPLEKTKPKGAERLPPNIVVRESDLHMRRLWGHPREDTPPRKYLLVLTVGYSDRDNVNAMVHKFSDNFDVMLFHYDGRTTEWDEFEWSKQAIHVSARKQAKWWYAKRFMHPSIVAPYEYVFLWDHDLGVETFDAEEYIKIVKKHGLEISQPGLDIVRGVKSFDINVRRNDTEIHTSTSAGKCSTIDVHQRPCSGFVEVMAPVLTREAWSCVWHMIQNDLVHGWGLDWNFWRCVDEPEQQIGVVDAQYVAHHEGFTLGNKDNDTVDGSRRKVRLRSSAEFGMLKARLYNADRAQAAALLAKSNAAPPS